MSSILKALKKLEEEKSLLDEPKEINVSREILKQPPENRQLVRWLWLLGSSAALVIIMLTFALLRKPATTEVAEFREQPLAAQPAAQAQLQNLPGPAKMSGSVKESRPASPLLSSEPRQKPSRQLQDQADSRLIRGEKVEMPGSAAPDYDPKKTEPMAKTAPERTAVTSTADFTLSGIAWNRDSADRLAIINGQPTATGATVNGVVVEEILLDRVKLSHNGRIFELLIGKSTKPD